MKPPPAPSFIATAQPISPPPPPVAVKNVSEDRCACTRLLYSLFAICRSFRSLLLGPLFPVLPLPPEEWLLHPSLLNLLQTQFFPRIMPSLKQ